MAAEGGHTEDPGGEKPAEAIQGHYSDELLVVGTFAQTVLVSCRREDWCLRAVALQALSALAVLPFSAWLGRPWAVGWAALAVEAAGAWLVCVWVGRLGLDARGLLPPRNAVVGCVALFGACRLASGFPLPAVCLAGGFAYVLAFVCLNAEAHRPRRASSYRSVDPTIAGVAESRPVVIEL